MAAKSPRPTWAGRLPAGLDPVAWSFLESLTEDSVLLEEDIVGTMAHVRALEAAAVLTAPEARKLMKALRELDPVPHGDEDVHSLVERTLTEHLGELGAKVHTARSRNDQVATDLRLYFRWLVPASARAVLGLQDALVARAASTAAMLAPGYTHLQRAQPITVGHWLLAHAWALDRDLRRLFAAYDAADASPLGAGALAGNTLGVGPETSAAALGFTRTFDNTLDAVSDRDFVLDAYYACAVAAVHLSRLAEEIVLWSTPEFGFVRLPDAFATGSSMMPQKKNPDVAELARGEVGPALGSLTSLAVVLKSLPLAYGRDLQVDKRHLLGVYRLCLAFAAMTGLVRGLEFDDQRLREAASDDALCATDLAEALVGRGVPFRRAHEQVGSLAAEAERRRASLRDVVTARPDTVSPLSLDETLSLLDVRASVKRRGTPGGPSPASVRAQVGRLRRSASRSRAHIHELVSRQPTRRTVG